MGNLSDQKLNIPCSVEILTRNSGATLGRCLESVKNFAEIIVLDGNSTDNTLAVARRYGCRILKQYDTDEPAVKIENYSEVRNKGLLAASYEWFMYIDSDEYLSPEAVEEIRTIVSNPSPEVLVFWQPRKYVLGGKIIDCATTYPNQQIRFFHKSAVTEFIKPIHERIEVKPGVEVGSLRSFEYVPLEDIPGLRSRWERYIKMEARGHEGASRDKLIRFIFKHVALLILFSLRYLRGLILCGGKRLPFSYEYARHRYTAVLIGLLIRRLFKL